MWGLKYSLVIAAGDFDGQLPNDALVAFTIPDK